MSEQPPWETIFERALSTRYRDRTRNQAEAVDWAARQYLASLDAPAPSYITALERMRELIPEQAMLSDEEDARIVEIINFEIERIKYASAPSVEMIERQPFVRHDTGSPKDGTREPIHSNTTYREGRDRDGFVLWSAASSSPPVPQEGTREPPLPIIDEMDPRHVSNPGTGAHVLDHRSPPVTVSEEMLDRAIEGYWCNATKNTHRTALRRALEAALAPLLEENARLREVSNFHSVGQAAAEARVKELEVRHRSWHWVKERKQRKDD